jgi:hypothetical protein
MAFPSKHLKPITSVPVAADIKSRREFIEDLPKKVKNTVRGVDLILINEAIAAISAGRVTINGKKPKTRSEMYVLIASYFKSLRTPLHMYFDEAEHVADNYTVIIKDKVQPVILKITENPVAN